MDIELPLAVLSCTFLDVAALLVIDREAPVVLDLREKGEFLAPPERAICGVGLLLPES